MYKLDQFNDIQEAELETKKDLFKSSTDNISKLLIKTYQDLFVCHGPEIQKEWLTTMRKLDHSLEKALKNSVKATLLDF